MFVCTWLMRVSVMCRVVMGGGRGWFVGPAAAVTRAGLRPQLTIRPAALLPDTRPTRNTSYHNNNTE